MVDTLKFVGRVSFSLLKRPKLIPTAFRQAGALVPHKWWSSGSRLPYPRADYLEFRYATLSGDANQEPAVHDVIDYLEWCRSMRALPSRA